MCIYSAIKATSLNKHVTYLLTLLTMYQIEFNRSAFLQKAKNGVFGGFR